MADYERLIVPLSFPIHYVYQTRFGAPNGNCLAACIASITGLPLDHIDNIIGTLQEWDGGERIQKWLAENGWLWVYYPFSESLTYTVSIPHMLTGTTKSGLAHCVVAMSGEVIHNPNRRPDAELVTVQSLDLLVPCSYLHMEFATLPSVESMIEITKNKGLDKRDI